MLDYPTLPTTVRPMGLLVTSEEFALEWRLCRKDYGSDLSGLLTMVDPFLRSWVGMLAGTQACDINHLTLCRLISPRSIERAQQMIRNWTAIARSVSSVFEELQLLFIERFRGLKYTPQIAKPIMLEYVVARDFKRALRHKIVNAQGQRVSELLYSRGSIDSDEIGEQDSYPDFLLLEDPGLTRWEAYLFKLIRQGLDVQSISQYTHIPTRKYQEQEQQVWLKLERKWQKT